ncbi:hypothetical protein [Nonomuraea sp. NPDC050783]|uniref:hypothetical protein n=1 Tax=Nonomuraea sp. NPDC050783 TaxID=3154634 RepID=UPI0034667ABD
MSSSDELKVPARRPDEEQRAEDGPREAYEHGYERGHEDERQAQAGRTDTRDTTETTDITDTADTRDATGASDVRASGVPADERVYPRGQEPADERDHLDERDSADERRRDAGAVDVDDDEFARSEQATVPSPPPRSDDAYATAVPGAVTAGGDDVPYREPYPGTGGDGTQADEHDERNEHDERDERDGLTPAAAGEVPAETPAHAAPSDVTLFDQDPAEVQARWRDLQAGFVDDPSDAVQRADGLLGEVVESLTSSLTSRTAALRERWKDVEAPDTEQLRQALREYRNVLERLLALSSASAPASGAGGPQASTYGSTPGGTHGSTYGSTYGSPDQG